MCRPASSTALTPKWRSTRPSEVITETGDQAGNLLRAPLGSPTCGLTNMYGYYPNYYLHTLGLGGTFGEAIRLRQNSTTTYEQNDVNFSGGVHIALMGRSDASIVRGPTPFGDSHPQRRRKPPGAVMAAIHRQLASGVLCLSQRGQEWPIRASDAQSCHRDHLDRQQCFVGHVHLPGQGGEAGNHRQWNLHQYQPGHHRHDHSGGKRRGHP